MYGFALFCWVLVMLTIAGDRFRSATTVTTVVRPCHDLAPSPTHKVAAMHLWGRRPWKVPKSRICCCLLLLVVAAFWLLLFYFNRIWSCNVYHIGKSCRLRKKQQKNTLAQMINVNSPASAKHLTWDFPRQRGRSPKTYRPGDPGGTDGGLPAV